MMETKLLAALCALLLVNLGSADHDNHDAATSNATKSGGVEAASEAPAAESVPVSSLEPINHAVTAPTPNDPDTNPSSRVASSLSNDTTTEGKTISLTPEPKKDNGTNVVPPSEAAGPEKNLTDPSTSQPPILSSGSHAPTSHFPLTFTTINPIHTAHSAPADTALTTTPPTNTSNHGEFPLPDSITPSNQSTHPKTHSFTSAPTPEPPKLETSTCPTTTISRSSSTSSTSSSQEAPDSESPTLASQQSTLQPDERPKTTSVAHQKPTFPPPSSTSAQAKAHADTPSQLNVGGDTTMVHESPTLDPLLAGLVSAFIITAVIITLLLFLKLRRRDNRPEFRRLQDLPMDDMMEDTPLSMYSY